MASPQVFRVRFRLKADTIATTADSNGKETPITVPTDSTIAVLEGLNETAEHNRRVEVQWLGKTLQMFAADILERGVQV